MHGIELSVSDESSSTTPDQLAALAAEQGAVAAVVFVRDENEAAVSIWIGNPSAGSPMTSTISAGTSERAPSVLALRAVEYLRVNLGDFGGVEIEAPPPVSAEMGETPAPPPAPRPKPSVERPSRWFFHGGISALASLPDPYWAVGPSLAGLGWQPRPWVALRAMGAAPLLGTRDLDEQATQPTALYFLLGTGEATLETLVSQRLRIAGGAAGGVAYIELEGNPGAIESSPWVAVVGPTAGLGLVLSPHTELRLDGQSLWFMPTVVATAGHQRATLGRPAFVVRLGVVVRP